MKRMLQRNWWLFGLLALLFMIFGIIAVTAPAMTPHTLMSYMGVMLLAFGIIIIIGLVSFGSKSMATVPVVIFALLVGGMGIYTLLNTEQAAKVYSFFMGLWAFIMGLGLLYAGYRSIEVKLVLYLNGILSVLFALAMLMNPFGTAISVNFILGFYTLLISLLLYYLSYRLQRWNRQAPTA